MLSGAGFYGVLLLCLAAVGTGAYFLLFQNRTAEPVLPASSAEQAAATSIQEVTPTVPVVETVPAVPAAPEETEKPAAQVPAAAAIPIVDDTPVVPEAPSLVVSPLSGQVVAAFSVDELAYNATLDDWRTHDGVDIAAAAGTNVLAASAGTVLSVSSDDLLGTTVVLGHSGGYQTTYANLQARPTVSQGDKVSAGQVIGAVGTTALTESAEGPHLHFSVCKDGDAVNPEEYLKR
jgi:murein DD-endopeptidase MepM/ murein hydrolase activator NlpD